MVNAHSHAVNTVRYRRAFRSAHPFVRARGRFRNPSRMLQAVRSSLVCDAPSRTALAPHGEDYDPLTRVAAAHAVLALL